MNNPSNRDDSAGETLLLLPADFLACDADALKQELLSALSGDRPVELRGRDVTRAGTASLQLLLAFLREASRRQLPVRLSAPSPQLLDALTVLGLHQVSEVQSALRGQL